MRKTWKKILSLALAGVMSVGLLTGCASSGDGKGTKTENGNEVLFTYDDTDVTLKEAWLYAKMLAAQYEETYSSYYGSDFWSMSMGTDDDGNDQTFEDYVKEQVISQMKETIVLCKKAEKYDCSLTHAEKESCSDSALSYYNDDDGRKVMKECGATREDVEKIYQDTTLASKVEEAVKDKADVEVTEDEARKTTIYRIVFETTTTADDGTTKEMGKKKKAKVKKKAEKILKKIQNGKMTIEEAAEAQDYSNTDESYAAGESEEGEEFEEVMKGMEDGDLADEVLECDNGYVIAKLVAYTDEDETASNKETLLEEKQTESYNDTYDEWTEDLEEEWDYDEDVDQKLWAEVKLSSADSTSTESTEETEAATEESTEGSSEAATEAATEAESTAAETTTEAK